MVNRLRNRAGPGVAHILGVLGFHSLVCASRDNELDRFSRGGAIRAARVTYPGQCDVEPLDDILGRFWERSIWFVSANSVTKTALISMSEALAQETRHHRIDLAEILHLFERAGYMSM